MWLGWLMILNFLITLANEAFINIIFDDSKCKMNVSVAGVIKKFTVKCKHNRM